MIPLVTFSLKQRITNLNKPVPTARQLRENISYVAEQLGFGDSRVAAIQAPPNLARYQEWLAEGMYGDMSWFERNNERRSDPALILEGAQSIVCLAMNYNPGLDHPNEQYRIAKYSWNNDYHDMIESKLKDLDLAMQEMGGTQRYYVDTGPVLERDFASVAGLGWNGKSTVQIHRQLGTWFFLAEIITTLDIERSDPIRNRCGSCTRCMVACPTQAITGPQEMDARKCISYLTIEHKGAIPLEYRKAIGNRIYGCDECLEVCPWNKFAKLSQEADFHARQEVFDKSLQDFLVLSDDDFRALFAKSPIKRIKRNRFLRNVCVALGNVGSASDIPALKKCMGAEDDPLILEHAAWALEEIESRI